MFEDPICMGFQMPTTFSGRAHLHLPLFTGKKEEKKSIDHVRAAQSQQSVFGLFYSCGKQTKANLSTATYSNKILHCWFLSTFHSCCHQQSKEKGRELHSGDVCGKERWWPTWHREHRAVKENDLWNKVTAEGEELLDCPVKLLQGS